MKNLMLLMLLTTLSMPVFCQDFETYENKEKKYSIDFPKGWVTAHEKNAFVSILAANDGVDLSKRVVVVASTSVALSTKEAYHVNLRNIKSEKKNTIEEEGSATINGMEALWAIYSFDNDGVKTKVKMYVIKNKKMQYIIQSVIPADDFNATVANYDSIIGTFKTI